MGSARILGCAVEVKRNYMPQHDETSYIFSGPGAAPLDAICRQVGMQVTEIIPGPAFSIDGHYLDGLGDMPIAIALQRGIRNAVKGESRASGF